MLWIVLPLTSADIGAIPSLYVVYAIATADIGVAIEIVIHVDVDVIASPSTTPTPAAAPCGTHGHADTKGDSTRRDHCSG